MARRSKLRLVSQSNPPEEKRAPVAARPKVRAGGLFSETQMPYVEEDAISDPDVFFTLPKTISLLKEQIEFGNLEIISKKTGIRSAEIKRLLANITSSDISKLRKIRMALEPDPKLS